MAEPLGTSPGRRPAGVEPVGGLGTLVVVLPTVAAIASLVVAFAMSDRARVPADPAGVVGLVAAVLAILTVFACTDRQERLVPGGRRSRRRWR